MKKGIGKKLLLTGMTIITLGAALTGCAQEEGSFNGGNVSYYGNPSYYCINKNVYIVVSEKGVETLHKGSILVPCTSVSNGLVYPPVLNFNCGEELQTSQYVAYPKYCPSEDKYDEVCDCAKELTK